MLIALCFLRCGVITSHRDSCFSEFPFFLETLPFNRSCPTAGNEGMDCLTTTLKMSNLRSRNTSSWTWLSSCRFQAAEVDLSLHAASET